MSSTSTEATSAIAAANSSNAGNNNDTYDYYGDYDYYYLEDPSRVVDEKALVELCHALLFSGFFLFLFSLVVLSCLAFLLALWRRRIRAGANITATDTFTALILIAGVIKLSSKAWQSLLLHGYAAPAPSQTGCKLASFTDVGMAHVITLLVCSMMLSALWAIRSEAASFSDLDALVRRHIAWGLLAVFAVEGAAGMVPAMYIDLSLDGLECNATQSLSITAEGFVSGHVLLFSVLPFLLPFSLCVWPAARLYSATADEYSGGNSPQDEGWCADRRQARTALFVFSSYALVYTPVALVTVIVFPALLSRASIDMITACHFEGAFRIFEDLWFPFLTAMVVLRDRDLGRGLGPQAKQAAQGLWDRVRARGAAGGAERRDGSNLNAVRIQ